jgi:predicted nucleic acid-binding Zn ribbon protein
MSRPRSKMMAPERLDMILERAGESRFAPDREPIASSVWRDAVGARIAERARPVSLQDGVLLLLVSSSVWAHELSLLSDDVRGRLKERGVAVRELRFRVGPMPGAERAASLRAARTVPARGPAPHELMAVLAAVADADLRAAIEDAATANLAWQSAVRERPAEAISEARRAARAPRSAGAESVPPAPATPPSRASPRGTLGGGRDRSR